MTLTDFLMARIGEDEAVASACTAWDDSRSKLHEGGRYVEVSPVRVLAECEAKRRIVEEHELTPSQDRTGVGCYNCEWDRDWGAPNSGGCVTLRLLALPYADHPDYREEWKP